MGRDRTQTRKRTAEETMALIEEDAFSLRLSSGLWVDSAGNDAGDRLRPGRHSVAGGVDPGRADHHPAAGPAGPGDGESQWKALIIKRLFQDSREAETCR